MCLEIYLVPDGAAGGQSVELHLRAMQPIVVTGGPDDEDVKRVLSFVMTNSQRYDSDVRMDSVDVLRSSSWRRRRCSARVVRNVAARCECRRAFARAGSVAWI